VFSFDSRNVLRALKTGETKHMKRVLYLFMSAVLLTGCATTTFYTSKKLAPEARRIALVSPDIELSIMNAGGLSEPHAEWTLLAEKHLSDGIRKKLKSLKIQLIDNQVTRELETDDAQEVQLIKLHEAVGSAILSHQFIEQLRLPSKKGKFEWTLGRSAGYLRDKYGADYALFIYIRDSYAGAGRVAVIAVAALLGVGVQGGVQIGFASLVDLKSGEIVWFNRLARASGDLRTVVAAKETVSQLLADFPQ
jgi:PBP1b-binding outer membrane lipoprotein LpoB